MVYKQAVFSEFFQ